MHPGSVWNVLNKIFGQQELDEEHDSFFTVEDQVFSKIKILARMICLLNHFPFLPEKPKAEIFKVNV